MAYKDQNKPSKKSKFRQGYFRPENIEKYAGDLSKIIYRSSWEYKFCKYCDLTDKILSWSSEPFPIKYYDPINKKERSYYVDFYIKYADSGTVVDYLVEVKPKKKLYAPILEGKQTHKKLKAYNHEMSEYIINKAKISAAQKYSMTMNYKFIIVTEDFLYINDMK
jgi:hypothetical protein